MDGKRLAKDTVSPAAGISPSKVKLRDGRDKSSVSRIKKLRQRISASFGRLLYAGASTEKEPTETNHALSKEDTIPEHDPEVDDITTNGHHSHHSDGSSPPVYYSLNGTPDHRPVPHRLLQCLGHSLDETFDPSLVFQPSVYRDCASQSSLGHPSQCNYSGSVADDRNSAAIYASGHTSVKRHHSTGDMLIAANTNHTVTPVRTRPLRPKSEGSFCMDGMRGKRASSFGYNSPFGKVDAYEKQEQLGEGSYATVYKGLSLLTNKVVALKEIRLQAEEGTPFTAIREASLLKGLKHANIVILHDIIHTKDTLTFVFEFVHTDLGQYLEKHTGGLNPRNIKLFLFQLLRGLLFCHSRRILHRDLKPQNLLISEIGELKLADFGLARAKSVPSKTYSHEVVTLWYRPPDVLLGSTDYTTSLDMWGVGCIFTEMVSGTATFPGMKDAWDQLDRIWQVLGTATEETWEGVTSLPHYCLDKFGFYPPRRLSQSVPKLAHIPYAEQLAHNLLQLEPRKRILAQDALYHQYFSDLPAKIYDLPDVASIFNIPGVKLAPEMDELLRTHIRTNPHASKPHSRSTGQSSSYKGPSAV